MVAEKHRHTERLAAPYVRGVPGTERSTGHYESEAALRWRDVLLRLSDNMVRASKSRPELAPLLRHALDHAIEMLLTQGDEEQLLRLEQWLNDAEASMNTAPRLARESRLRIAA